MVRSLAPHPPCPLLTPPAPRAQVKNLSLMAYISVGSAPEPILEFLEEWATENLEEIQPSAIPAATKVFILSLLNQPINYLIHASPAATKVFILSLINQLID